MSQVLAFVYSAVSCDRILLATLFTSLGKQRLWLFLKEEEIVNDHICDTTNGSVLGDINHWLVA